MFRIKMSFVMCVCVFFLRLSCVSYDMSAFRIVTQLTATSRTYNVCTKFHGIATRRRTNLSADFTSLRLCHSHSVHRLASKCYCFLYLYESENELLCDEWRKETNTLLYIFCVSYIERNSITRVSLIQLHAYKSLYRSFYGILNIFRFTFDIPSVLPAVQNMEFYRKEKKNKLSRNKKFKSSP